MPRGEIYIGTSGWHYPHWRGPFYPEGLPAARMFDYYAHYFQSVELNNTFYKLPDPHAVEQWREASPPRFRFAVKASRYLTHVKKLRDTGPGIANYFSRLELLGEKLGPVVIQLPPQWEVNAARLEEFLDALPGGHRYAVEPRNASWHTPEVYAILRRRQAAFCIFEIGGFHSPLEITADFVYLRLHGPGEAYQGWYAEAALERWAERVREWQARLQAVYLYFDNDAGAYAVDNALRLKRILGA